MREQRTLWKLTPIESDVVYTPENIALNIIRWCRPKGLKLDPCAGDWVFFNNFSEPRDWCEITLDRDFFDYQERVDWIIGNPPYSIFEDFLAHSFELANDVVYILPTNKIFQRIVIMKMIVDWGGIFAMRIYGSGQRIGFPFGFSVGAFHFKKGWRGPTNIDFWMGFENGL